MSEQPFDRWESQLEQTARTFSYPPTPDIAHTVSRRLSARRAQRSAYSSRAIWPLVAAALVIIGLLLVPPVRAGILEVLRIGAVRIWLVEPTSTPLPPTSEPTRTQPTITPRPSPLTSVLELEGETTLGEARQRLTFPIRLPGYPADLGPPDKVFVQDFGEPLLILVWLDDAQPERVKLSLYQFPPGPYAEKSRPAQITPATVNGAPAFWTEGPHMLITRSRHHMLHRLVNGPVLIWTEGTMTYRLESDLPEAEAIRIAESLR
jgi:hypothetical protein